MARDNAITYLKALGIICMVLGHSSCSVPYVGDFLAMFHMPLFFIASGYCFKEKYLEQPVDFLKRKVTGIYKPFVKWSLVFVLLHIGLVYLHVYDQPGQPATNDWRDTLNSLQLIVLQMRGNDKLLGGYWFLNALFFGNILAYVILRYVRRPLYRIIVATTLLTVVHLTNFHVVFLNLNTRAFVAMWLIITGCVMARVKMPVFAWWGIIASFVATFIGSWYCKIAIDHIRYEGWQLFPYLIIAVLCTWSFYSVFSRWKEVKNRSSQLMNFIGRNTMTVLTWHLLSFIPVTYLIVCLYGLPVERMGSYPVIEEYAAKGWWIVYWIVGLTSCCIVAYVREKIERRQDK